MTTPAAPSTEAIEPLRYPDHTHLPCGPGEAARPYKPLPTHKDLPDKDGAFVRNTQEPHQSALLEQSLSPVLRRLHPNHDYFIGMDTGLYWRIIEPPLRGCKAPDWFLVRGVPHLLDGDLRRSYVLWQEHIAPLIILEYAADGTAQEHDRTPLEGKFWVYEQAIHPSIYGIFEWNSGRLEVFHRVEDQLDPMLPNENGRYPISPLGVELGVWRGRYNDFDDLPWLRWWDAAGNLLPTPGEMAQQAHQKTERLATKLRALGVDPDQP